MKQRYFQYEKEIGMKKDRLSMIAPAGRVILPECD